MQKMMTVVGLSAVLMANVAVAKDNPLTWSEAVLTQLSTANDVDYDALGAAYMQVFQWDTFLKYKDDEINFEDKRLEAVEAMKKKVASFKPVGTYTMNMSWVIGKYDVANGTFPVSGEHPYNQFDLSNEPYHFPEEVLSADSLYLVHDDANTTNVYGFKDEKTLAAFPKEIKLSLVNGDAIKPLAMDKNAASALVKTFSGRDGVTTPRYIDAKVTFHLKDYDAGTQTWSAEVNRIEYFTRQDHKPLGAQTIGEGASATTAKNDG